VSKKAGVIEVQAKEIRKVSWNRPCRNCGCDDCIPRGGKSHICIADKTKINTEEYYKDIYAYGKKAAEEDRLKNKERNEKKRLVLLEKNPIRGLGLSTGAMGKISEQLVCIDLIKRGWFVYTAFEPTHPFDVLIIKNDVRRRVEVKTGSYDRKGREKKITDLKKENFDILAVVYDFSRIEYTPAEF